MADIPESDKCPKCKGSTIILTRNGGGMSCTACGGRGLSYKARKARAEVNKSKNIKRYDEIQRQYSELNLAINQFKPKTNLDVVLKQHAEERLRELYFLRLTEKPRGANGK